MHLQNIVVAHAAAMRLLVLSSAFPSLHLPQAALGNAHSRASRRERSSFYIKTKKRQPERLSLLSMGYKKDIFAVFAYDFELLLF